MAIKRYSGFPKLQHYWSIIIRLFSVICKTFVGGVLLLCRDAVGVFYNPSRQSHSLGESYPSAVKQSVYSATPADRATRWGSLTPLPWNSRCILQLQPTEPLVGGVLPLCRETVGVFCNPSRQSHSLGESYPSAVKQSVYSATPADRATRWGSPTPLPWNSRCILQPQPTEPHTSLIRCNRFWILL